MCGREKSDNTMTALGKPLRRTTSWHAPHGVAERVVITLYPGGAIGLREVRRRKEVILNAATLYTQALLAERRQAKRQKGSRHASC